jgi:PBSX family phage portal protein
MSKSKPNVIARIIKGKTAQVQKAETATQISGNEAYNTDWIEPPTDLRGYKVLVSNSAILPQCIRAYKNNIAGFGIGVRYKDDIEETEQMAEEFTRAEKIIELLTTEQDTKELFEDLIEARETYGIGYIEVIRNVAGEVTQIEFIEETESVRKTRPLEPYIVSDYYYEGELIQRKRKFRKYKQTIGGKTVYFKEFGDPRIMDKRSGDYIEKGKTLEIQYQANEIMEFAIGTEPYGEVRWEGQILGVDGSRKAERLNNNYFENGRHTPLMIIVKGGTLTEESFSKLQTYMNDIKGEAGQHAFLLLETEGADGRVDFDAKESPQVEVKDIANVLQKDELFQEYMDNNRKKVQSAFQLPDLYVGYTTDFNRATALTAQEVTEEQVFQPERISLAWAINNKLLNAYQFKYVEVYFKEPNITNPDDIYKVLSVCSRAGGLTPNKAKEIIYSAYGQVSEDYEGEWGDIPIAVSQAENGQKTKEEPELQIDRISLSLEKQIQKAARNHDDAVVAVMKEVKNLLKARQNRDIMKWDPNQPRESNGQFASKDGGDNSSSATEEPADEPPNPKPVNGKDISKTFEYDPDSSKSMFDQICEAQGFNGPPSVLEHKEFNEAAKESGILCYRGLKDSENLTADEIKEQFMFATDYEAIGTGQRASGAGTYFTSTPQEKPGNTPKRADKQAARASARDHGDVIITSTLDRSSKTMDYQEALKTATSQAEKETFRKYNYDVGCYLASKGYDGVRRSTDTGHNVVLYNRTKAIVLDDRELERENRLKQGGKR